MRKSTTEYAPNPRHIFATCAFQGNPTVTDRAIKPTKSSLIKAAEKKLPLSTTSWIHNCAGGLASQVRTPAIATLRLSNHTKLPRTSCAHPPKGRKMCEEIS